MAIRFRLVFYLSFIPLNSVFSQKQLWFLWADNVLKWQKSVVMCAHCDLMFWGSVSAPSPPHSPPTHTASISGLWYEWNVLPYTSGYNSPHNCVQLFFYFILMPSAVLRNFCSEHAHLFCHLLGIWSLDTTRLPSQKALSPWGFKVIGHSCLVTKLLGEGQLPEEGHHLYDVEDYCNKPSLTVRLKYSQQRRKRIK